MKREQARDGASGRARSTAGRVADSAVEVVAGADAVVRRAGFTTKHGRISKGRLALAALRPRSSVTRLVRATAVEIDRRRRPRDEGDTGGQDGA